MTAQTGHLITTCWPDAEGGFGDLTALRGRAATAGDGGLETPPAAATRPARGRGVLTPRSPLLLIE
ncbi:hypothetical protein C1I63_05845 [Rathayibacter caricis DSM 15933]|uniref:Uncharacterized protein n=1 Tax=Rathayibacter caricis DSM 15933 TaxID=1328867 RepID=A0A2T4USB0_9MICO|nr:hypothetical protein C1I63_05845 [Rathayibacter caricis DSM 15933]